MTRTHDIQARLAAIVFVALLFAALTPRAALAVTTRTIAVTDATAESIAAAQAAYPTGSAAVIVVDGWRAQLAASSLAHSLDAAVLLARPGGPTAPLLSEVARLAPSRAFMLGRFDATAVDLLRSSLPTEATLLSVDSTSPTELSALVGLQTRWEAGSRAERVLVTSDRHPELVWGLAAISRAKGWPILFIDPADPHSVSRVAAGLEASSAVLIDDGSPAVASAERGLRKRLGPFGVRAIRLTDRNAAAATLQNYAEQVELRYGDIAVTSGTRTSAALTAAHMAGRLGSPLIVVPSGGPGSSQVDALFARRAGLRSVTFVGTEAELPIRTRRAVLQAFRAPAFSTSRAMRHLKVLVGFGPRRAGSTAERRALDYSARQLASWGYSVRTQSVSLPGGRRSRNVYATKSGRSTDVIVIGGHIDSKPPSPGGNDNGSGSAVTLELARMMAKADLVPTVTFVLFGAEEISGSSPDDHHFGSRTYVRRLTSSQRARIESMLSVDMVGYGRQFTARNLQRAPMTTVRSLQSWGRASGQPLAYLKDPSRTGWSDHEAFEFRGIPVAWLEWRDDPAYHTRRDTYGHVSSDRVGRTGRLVRGWLLELDSAEVDRLRP